MSPLRHAAKWYLTLLAPGSKCNLTYGSAKPLWSIGFRPCRGKSKTQELGQGRDAGQVVSWSPSNDACFPGMSSVHGAIARFPKENTAGAGSGLCSESRARSAFKYRLRFVTTRSCGKAAHPHLASAAKHLLLFQQPPLTPG